mmetsp:Transcript_23380/g.46094  ORF Transcript_23380/g.46094 Transcript_23380/m.46094 type:complete len:200 (-) Transcript_23380:423-1022(-)
MERLCSCTRGGRAGYGQKIGRAELPERPSELLLSRCVAVQHPMYQYVILLCRRGGLQPTGQTGQTRVVRHRIWQKGHARWLAAVPRLVRDLPSTLRQSQGGRGALHVRFVCSLHHQPVDDVYVLGTRMRKLRGRAVLLRRDPVLGILLPVPLLPVLPGRRLQDFLLRERTVQDQEEEKQQREQQRRLLRWLLLRRLLLQ